MSARPFVTRELDVELKRLVVGTNDQRRRVGQALFHFYRTLIFWKDKGLSFAEVTRAWSAGGAAIFDTMARRLEELGDPGRDGALRAFTAGFLDQLADDLDRGDHTLISFLRWLEGRFPRLTEMMQQETEATRIYDVALADLLARLFAFTARSDPREMVGIIREAAQQIRS